MQSDDAAVLLTPKCASTRIHETLCRHGGWSVSAGFADHPGRKYVVWRDPVERYKSGVVEAWRRADLGCDVVTFVKRHLQRAYYDEHLTPQALFVNGPVDEIVPFDQLADILPARLGVDAGCFAWFTENREETRSFRAEVPINLDELERLYAVDFAVWRQARYR